MNTCSAMLINSKPYGYHNFVRNSRAICPTLTLNYKKMHVHHYDFESKNILQLSYDN